jgi:hypothetical protein
VRFHFGNDFSQSQLESKRFDVDSGKMDVKMKGQSRGFVISLAPHFSAVIKSSVSRLPFQRFLEVNR